MLNKCAQCHIKTLICLMYLFNKICVDILYCFLLRIISLSDCDNLDD